jgi:5-formyltetrahydrofolate cyclo-ligase
MPKKGLRQRLLLERRSISLQEKSAADLNVQLNLIERPEFQAATTVALYVAIRGEAETRFAAEQLLRVGKRLLLPSVIGPRMIFRGADSFAGFTKGAFGIPEPPDASSEYSAGDADVIVVPGVAFDLAGRRLGYGQGYYDRFLHGMEGSGRLFGLCYDFQLVDRIPDEPHDVLMDWVITDRRVIGPLRRS